MWIKKEEYEALKAKIRNYENTAKYWENRCKRITENYYDILTSINTKKSIDIKFIQAYLNAEPIVDLMCRNPILRKDEVKIVKDFFVSGMSNFIKIGDGVRHFNDLPYIFPYEYIGYTETSDKPEEDI